MQNVKLATEKLRSKLAESIFDAHLYTIQELTYMLNEAINTVFNYAYTELYVFNEWSGSYNLVEIDVDKQPSWTQHMSSNQKRLLKDTENFMKQTFLTRMCKKTDGLTTMNIGKLNPAIGVDGFLLLAFHDTHVEDLLIEGIYQEVERALSIINLLEQSKWNNDKNEYLLNLATRMNAPKEISYILEETHQTLEKFYPNFKHTLYLSQDYDTSRDLPVNLINFNDKSIAALGIEAFITGKLQVASVGEETSIYFPIKGNQAVYGVIQVTAPYEIYPENKFEFISKISSIVGVSLENTILFQSSNHLVSDLKMIERATHKINESMKLNDLIKIVKNQIIQAINASEVGFIYYNESDLVSFEILPGGTSFFNTKAGKDFAAKLVKKMKIEEGSIFQANIQSEYPELPYHSLMCLPMEQSGRIHGFSIILHKEASFFTFGDFKLMQSLMKHSTLALTNTILKEDLKNAVITDYLTNLYNRNYLDEMLTMHMEIDKQGAIILIDIDDFKQINDSHGHQVGDDVIVQVANLIKENINEDAIPTRWGGEELVVYLPHASLEEAESLAEVIRKQIEKRTIPQVTVSCGITTWSTMKRETTIELFLRVDKALYEAKHFGKNNVIKAE